MRAGDLYKLFRADADDVTEPYLWSDVEVYTFLNDAYFMFVRLTGGVQDVTSAACTIPIVTGERDAALDPSILRIREAYLSSNNYELKILNAENLEGLTTEDYGVLRKLNNFTDPGPVRYMVTGLQDQLVRWIHVPAEDDTANLVVDRLPLEPINNAAQALAGVRDEHHYHLLKWMRHLAYRKQDSETFDLAKSDQERDDFYAYCAMAQQEKDRRRHKVRVVQYGGL